MTAASEPAQSRCALCSALSERVVLDLRHAVILLPLRAHIAAKDGGHLVVVPRRHEPSRMRLTPVEMLSMEFGSLIASVALTQVLGTDWFNYQENGNWSVESADRHMHLHVYGRSKEAEVQTYGEALRFPLRVQLDTWHVPSLSRQQAADIREAARSAAGSPDFGLLRDALGELSRPV
ncbi:hypothetical protein OHT93_36590 [Streptomyces sp. NBC_00191]|uniref:hypothetical protein n=1 Tax=Streptomyces sp. NBC_00191 TaxID=2975674 RepID=UPI00324B7FDC